MNEPSRPTPGSAEREARETEAVPAAALGRAHVLRERLTQLQRQYYLTGRPEVDDRRYDALFDELSALEQRFPQVRSADSPTHRVGSDLSRDFPEIRHRIPVLSLDKAYQTAEVLTWITKTVGDAAESAVSIEEKLDGVSMVLYYHRGLLESAVTRGNGSVGNDVTANVRTIPSIPLSIAWSGGLAVRGEVFMTHADFDRINSGSEQPFANPRNLVAGTLRRAKSSEVAPVPLRFFAYEGFFLDPSPVGDDPMPAITSHAAMLDLLRSWSFPVSDRVFRVPTDQPEQLALVIERARAERRELPYDIDGLVIKIDDLAARDRLGYTGHHPRWAIALKFESPEGQTTVKSIDVQIGRTGRLTPVARLEPVRLGGSTISNVTLHNQEYIDSLELSPGDRVAVSRRGDVIPAVERVIDKNPDAEPSWRMPDHCPGCGAAVEKRGAHHFCSNFACPERVAGRLRFFVGKGGMDIDGLGPETLTSLINDFGIVGVPDLFTFDWQRLVGAEGFGAKKIAALQSAVEAGKQRPFATVLAALGIPELGPKVVELLIADGFRAIDDLFALIDCGPDATVDRLTGIKGIGRITAQTIYDELSQPATRAEIAQLRTLGLVMAESAKSPASSDEPPTGALFSGQVWCVTGSFARFSPRSQAMDIVRGGGGGVSSDVGSKTTHLLAGANAGGKLGKAQKLGITIVSEDQFVAMAGLD